MTAQELKDLEMVVDKLSETRGHSILSHDRETGQDTWAMEAVMENGYEFEVNEIELISTLQQANELLSEKLDV